MEYGDKLETLYRKFEKIKSVMTSCLKNQKEGNVEYLSTKEERLKNAYEWGLKILDEQAYFDDKRFYCDYYLPIRVELNKFHEKMKEKLLEW